MKILNVNTKHLLGQQFQLWLYLQNYTKKHTHTHTDIFCSITYNSKKTGVGSGRKINSGGPHKVLWVLGSLFPFIDLSKGGGVEKRETNNVL